MRSQRRNGNAISPRAALLEPAEPDPRKNHSEAVIARALQCTLGHDERAEAYPEVSDTLQTKCSWWL